MELIELNPTEIKITTARFRTDPGDVEGLADSIKRTGQILPIRITKDKQLIDGGRRLAACLMLDKKIACVFDETVSEVDELILRSMELEGNLHRKDFTPAEEARAVREVHLLRQKLNPLHTVRDTAKLLGRTSHSSVLSDIKAADMVDAFPELKNAKNKREIMRVAKAANAAIESVKNVERNAEEFEKTGSRVKLKCCNSLEEMQHIPDNSIDILITDPLYEINSHVNKIRSWDKYANRFDDSFKGLEAYKILAYESYRFTSNASHGYVFVGPEYFTSVSDIFKSFNWYVFVKPLIWIKGTTGQCNVPGVWPSSCYEMLLYIRKENSQLVKQGQPDWISVPPVHGSHKKHAYEKPIELIENLLDRSALPGQTLFDPFMGSGAILKAGLNKNLFVTGYDIEEESYNTALNYLAE